MCVFPDFHHRRQTASFNRPVAGLLCMALLCLAGAHAAAQSPPAVPKPRPAAEATVPREKPVPEAEAKPVPIEDAPLQAKPAFDLASAQECEAELGRLGAQFTVLEPEEGDGQCGWPRPLNLEHFPGGIETVGESKLRCKVALELARWTKEVVAPSAELHMGDGLAAIEVSTSYQCRRRNNLPTGKISEHGFANGVDLLAFRLASGGRVEVRDRRAETGPERAFQAAIRGGACAYFTTVLGPGTNAAHAEHFHFDLAVRRGGYRLCE